jgi:hypothetical protein
VLVTQILGGKYTKHVGKGGTHAALAPKISCLLALVNRLRIAEKANVETMRTPMQVASFLLPMGELAEPEMKVGFAEERR